MKNVFLFFIALLAGIALAIGLQVTRHTVVHNSIHALPQTRFSIALPPSESLKGTMLSFSGEVEWQSRIATQSVQLTAPQTVQQGESLETKLPGTAQVQFPNVGIISLAPETKIDFAQTLPEAMVLNQELGTTTYKITQPNTALSVRMLDLLTKIENGTSTITIDTDTNTIAVQVLSGQAIAAYNDINYQSNVVIIPPGQQFVFDEGAKEYTME